MGEAHTAEGAKLRVCPPFSVGLADFYIISVLSSLYVRLRPQCLYEGLIACSHSMSRYIRTSTAERHAIQR